MIALSIFAHSRFVLQNCKNKTTAGIFTDNKYSYLTFIHTYSLRFYNGISNEKAIEASTPLIGSPEKNNYSISKAILNNPKQFISNIAFNTKEIIDTMAHPLFMPFYFYLFIGLLLMGVSFSEKTGIIFLLILIILHLSPLLIFHIEIRYMQIICAFLLLLISAGASKYKNNEVFLYSIQFITFIIFMAYAINNRNSASLC